MHGFPGVSAEWAQVVIQVLGFVAVSWGLHTNMKAIQTTTALEFMKRFENLDNEISYRIIEASRSQEPSHLSDDDQQEFSQFVRKYLNLCSEEFALHRGGRIGRDIWIVWEKEIAKNFSSPTWRTAWSALRSSHESYPEFQQFIDRLVRT